MDAEQIEGLEEKEPFRTLLESCESLLDNLMVVEIVEAAPSPKAADKRMKDLGWPNEVAYGVRQATRLKFHYPEAWKAVKEPKKQKEPARKFFRFLGDSAISGAFVEDHISLGDFQYRRERPLLLSQMCCHISGDTVFGKEYRGWEYQPAYYTDNMLFDRSKEGCRIYRSNGGWEISPLTADLEASTLVVGMHVEMGTLRLDKTPGEFPDFCHLVQITNVLPTKMRPLYWERFRFKVHEDLGPHYRHSCIGKGSYQRVVVIDAQNAACARMAVVEKPFWLRLRSENESKEYTLCEKSDLGQQGVNLSFFKGETGFSGGGVVDPEEAMEALQPTLLKLADRGLPEYKIPLEAVAGRSLLEDPPAELLSLILPE